MEGFFNNKLLFNNNGLLFFYCFLETFVGGDKAVIEKEKSRDEGDPPLPPSPTGENPDFGKRCELTIGL